MATKTQKKAVSKAKAIKGEEAQYRKFLTEQETKRRSGMNDVKSASKNAALPLYTNSRGAVALPSRKSAMKSIGSDMMKTAATKKNSNWQPIKDRVEPKTAAKKTNPKTKNKVKLADEKKFY